MVSLLKLAVITEQGVKFNSPIDNSEMLLTPEESIKCQNNIGRKYICLCAYVYCCEWILVQFVVHVSCAGNLICSE